MLASGNDDFLGDKPMPLGLSKLKSNYLIGTEDMEPDVAAMVTGSHSLVYDLKDQVDKLRGEMHASARRLTEMMDSQIKGLKDEIRSTLCEHLEYI